MAGFGMMRDHPFMVRNLLAQKIRNSPHHSFGVCPGAARKHHMESVSWVDNFQMRLPFGKHLFCNIVSITFDPDWPTYVTNRSSLRAQKLLEIIPG